MAEAVATPMFWTETERCGDDAALVRCHGRLIAETAGMLYNTVRPLLATNPRVVLDLAELKHTDSLGLGTLARLYVSAKSAGCSLELMHLSKQVRYVLGITHMLDVFTVIGECGGMRFM